MEIRALLGALWRNKTGPALVALQVALTLAVVVNVTYVVQNQLEDANRPTGLDLDNMFWIITQPRTADYNYAGAVKADLAYLNSLPGVAGASTVNNLPQTFTNLGLLFASDPEAAQTPTKGGIPGNIYYGTDKFIDTMGLKLVAGRNFDPNAIMPPAAELNASLSAWAPEIIVTRAMANKLFPKGDALGKTVYAGMINKSSVVVGIVDFMRANPIPAAFDFFATQIVIAPITPPGPNGVYVVRAKPGRRDELMAKLDREFGDLQPGRFIAHMEAYDRTARNARQGSRSSATILAAVAFLVLAVSLVGIVGLTAFNVIARTKQLATRRALGARKWHILSYFLLENWLITTGGVLLGCVLTLAASEHLSRSYQIPPLPLYYLFAGIVLLWIIGLLAALAPAAWASSISPAAATRMV